jgi:predicted metalloprotease with PDZ domain
VNGIRVSSKDLSDKLLLAKDAPVKVHLFRRDELRELEVTPVLQPKGKAKLKEVDKPSPEQKLLDAAWLGVPWPKDEPAKK